MIKYNLDNREYKYGQKLLDNIKTSEQLTASVKQLREDAVPMKDIFAHRAKLLAKEKKDE